MRLAAIYTRISDDALGDGLGVARQESDCRDLAQRLGWQVAEVFSDNDTSAYSGKIRPHYERMLAELESGRLNALLCWDVDRLTRRPVELETIIDLAERRDVALASVGGEIDLATPQGRLTARIKASVARHEVEQASRRIKRKFMERAEAGLPHGKIAYGWRRVGGRDIIEPEQAAIIREATMRIIAGESVRSITLDLQRRGVPTPAGRERWHSVTLRQLVLRERNAGLRIHQKKVICSGNWEPIVSEDTYNRLTAILTDPSRKTASNNRHRNLLSGIAMCGACGEPLRVLARHGTRPRAYVCQVCFKVRRKQEAVDNLIESLVIARLGLPDAVQAFFPAPADIQPMLDNVEALRARLDVAADRFANDEITGDQLARITAKLRPDLEEAERRVRQASATPDLVDLASPDIGERWDGLPLSRKRAVIRLLMDIKIHPAGKTGRAEFDPSRIIIDWRTAP